jgi:hypothetical protein
VPGAEVVQREPHAELAQALEHVAGAARVAHHGVLGDLALEQSARDFPALQDVCDRLGQRRVDDVRGGQVDRHGQLHARASPRGALAYRGVEDPARDVPDQAGALGEAEELVRAQQPPLRVLPADERLHADHAAAAQRDLGLEVQDEFVVVEGVPQLAQELEALGRVGVARGGVGLDVRSRALGLVHRHVGVAQERRDVLAVVGLQRDADRGAELDGDAADVEGEGEGAVQAGGHLADGATVGQDGQDRELVPAEAGQDVVAAQQLVQALGDVDEQAVGLLVAHRVVDLLEAVEVDEHEGGERAVAARVGQRSGSVLVQLGAIRQPGERVVRGLVAQAARGARDDAKQAGPQEQQAGDECGEERPGVRRDGVGGRLVGHVALEDAAADRHVDLEEAALGAELVCVGLDVRVDLARERLADVAVARRVPADESVVVGPHDVAAMVVELAAQATRGEPPVERGDPIARERAVVGLAVAQLAGDADVGDGDGQALGVLEGAALDAFVQERPEGGADGHDDQQAHHAEGLQQAEARKADPHGGAVGAARLGLEARVHDADACAARAPGSARTARNAGSLGRRSPAVP